DVDAPDNKHSTPLHLASTYGSIKAVRLLLRHSANIHVQNRKGKTPFQVASARGHREIMQLLLEYVQSEREM
ncbi:ankyrin repeat-containing domain protein, partial [Lactifluus subvellereus]